MCSNKNRNIKDEITIKVPCEIRLLKTSVAVYTGAGYEYVIVDSVSKRDCPVIVKLKEGKNKVMWGKLKSGAGWIPLDHLVSADIHSIRRKTELI